MLAAVLILVVLGGLLATVGGIWLLIAAFREGVRWGLVVLLVPLGAVAFVIARWQAARTAMLIQLLAAVFLVAGLQLGRRAALEAGVGFAEASGAAQPSAEFVSRFKEAVAETTGGLDLKRRPSYIGRTLADVREELGRPEGILRSGRGVTYLYSDIELVAEDGATISSQHAPAH